MARIILIAAGARVTVGLLLVEESVIPDRADFRRNFRLHDNFG